MLCNHPYVPISKPEEQIKAVLDFCTAWETPIILEYNRKRYVLQTVEHYLKEYCTREEAAAMREELNNLAALTSSSLSVSIAPTDRDGYDGR